MKNCPLLGVRGSTPSLELRPATDELLDQLAEVVRAGKTHAVPAPYDDPMSFYEPDPDPRVAKWLGSIWPRRGNLEPGAWRLYFVVTRSCRPVARLRRDRIQISRVNRVAVVGHIFSLMSIRISSALTGMAVKKPRIIDSCIIIQ